MSPQVTFPKGLSAAAPSAGRAPAPAAGCHSGAAARGGLGSGCHSGIALAIGLLLDGSVAAQGPAPFEIALRDGQVVAATALDAGPAGGLRATVGGKPVVIGKDQWLAVHGAAVRLEDLPVAWLAGGDQVRGLLAGGDEQGERLELQSPVLGRLAVRVDRLAALSCGPWSPAALPLPEGVDEALFQRAAVGFDVVAGTLHRFGADGVSFQPEGQTAPRWFRPGAFAALRLGDPVPRRSPAAADLLTRTGDRLGIAVRGMTATELLATDEDGREFRLRWTDVACLMQRHLGTFVSEMEPQAVAESAADGEVVWPWQRDAAVLGGPLQAGGRAHGKGLGVHSKSRLSFVAPAGAAWFWTRVALDDSTAALLVRATAEVRILVDDRPVFAAKDVQAGAAPLNPGRLPVRPGAVVTLEVDCGRGLDLGDRVAWLTPVFLPADGP